LISSSESGNDSDSASDTCLRIGVPSSFVVLSLSESENSSEMNCEDIISLKNENCYQCLNLFRLQLFLLFGRFLVIIVIDGFYFKIFEVEFLNFDWFAISKQLLFAIFLLVLLRFFNHFLDLLIIRKILHRFNVFLYFIRFIFLLLFRLFLRFIIYVS